MSKKKSQPFYPPPALPHTGVESHAHLNSRQYNLDREDVIARLRRTAQDYAHAAGASADNCASTQPIRASQPASPSASRKRCPAHSSKTPGSTKANRLKANAHGIPIAPRKPSGCRRWAYSGRPIRAASKAPANNASAAAESLKGDVMPPC